MVFPIGDDNSTRRTVPIVTYILIVINVLVFLLELNRGKDFIRTWAFVPKEFAANPGAEIQTDHFRDVHAWRLGPSVRQYALSLDIRR